LDSDLDFKFFFGLGVGVKKGDSEHLWRLSNHSKKCQSMETIDICGVLGIPLHSNKDGTK